MIQIPSLLVAFLYVVIPALSYSPSNVQSVFNNVNDTHPAQRTKCLQPPRSDCSFYEDCLEPCYRCGVNGYPLEYGVRLCNAFKENRNTLSWRGQEWMADTMQCLQEALVPAVVSKVNGTVETCHELKHYAFSTHPRCYVLNGFCRLEFDDWAAVVEIVGVQTLVGWSAFKQELQTAEGCAEVYAHLFENFLFS